MRVAQNEFICKLALLVADILLVGAVYLDKGAGKYLLFVGIITNVHIIWCLRRSQPALIFGIYILSYLAYLFPYYFYGTQMGFHKTFYRLDIFNKVLAIHVLFLAFFNLFLKTGFNRKELVLRNLIPEKENMVIFFPLLFLLLLIIFNVKGQNIIGNSSSYQIYMSNLSKQSGVWEYFFIPFVICFFFTKMKSRRFLLLGTMLLYSYFSFTHGYRVQLIEMLLLGFILFLDGRLKNWIIVIFSIVGFVGMELYGALKDLGTASLGKLAVSVFNGQGGIILTNQTEVFYSSACYIGSLESGMITFSHRLLFTLGFCLNLILPSGMMPDTMKIPQFVKQFADFGGGGLISSFVYIWFGYIGLIVVAFLLASVFNQAYRDNERKIFKIILVLILGLYPRWFAYDPGNFLFRLTIYLFSFYFLIRAADVDLRRIFKKRVAL